MAARKHDETEANAPVSPVAQAVRTGLNPSPPYYRCTTERHIPEVFMRRANQIEPPARQFGWPTLKPLGRGVAFFFALFVVTGCT